MSGKKLRSSTAGTRCMGRRLWRQYSERRANGEVVHVEVAPGIVIVVAAWMLDAVACAGMELGAPRASVDALADLHRSLSQQGLRRSSSGVSHTREERHDPSSQTASTADDVASAATTSSASTEHRVRAPVLQDLDPSQRNKAVTQLALLLLQAAGVPAERSDHDER